MSECTVGQALVGAAVEAEVSSSARIHGGASAPRFQEAEVAAGHPIGDHPGEGRLPQFSEIPLLGYPERPVLFTHELHLDERLTREAVAELADRVPPEEIVYEKGTKPLLVPSEGAPRGVVDRPGDIIRDLDDGRRVDGDHGRRNRPCHCRSDFQHDRSAPAGRSWRLRAKCAIAAHSSSSVRRTQPLRHTSTSSSIFSFIAGGPRPSVSEISGATSSGGVRSTGTGRVRMAGSRFCPQQSILSRFRLDTVSTSPLSCRTGWSTVRTRPCLSRFRFIRPRRRATGGSRTSTHWYGNSISIPTNQGVQQSSIVRRSALLVSGL